jgi:cell wall-associated NlpC family hydrolase
MSKSNNLFVIRSLVAPSYSEPSFTSSKITEALSGETVKVLDKKNDWLYIEQDDGYKSWLKDFYGTIETEHFLSDYIVTEKLPYPFGTRLRYNKGTFLTVNDEKYISDKKPTLLDGKPKPDNIIKIAKKLIGCPYRWGGKSSLGFDCSGLVQTVFLAAGISLPRDTWQQSDYFIKNKIEGKDSYPGDLHFFGTKNKVTHVGISTGGFGIIHCQGWVKEEVFIHNEYGFNKSLADIYLHSCSIRLNFIA